MAGSDSDSSGASQLPTKLEATSTSITIKSYYTKLPRRQLTLIAITALLNILLWSSLICVITTVYQIASDPDTTSIPSHVLTLTSVVATIAYIFLHTVFSLKQRIWKHQRRNPSAIRKTSYVAIRLAVTLCILWLLTSGWNMIIVARRPVCLAAGPEREGWEAGTPCVVGRVGIAFAMIALIASGTLFGMLAMVRRPFEAHLLKHGYREPVNPYPTPAVSGRPTPSRLTSNSSERYHSGRRSASTHRSTLSNFSNADVETLDLNSSSPPTAVIHSPSPVRSIGLGIFTSDSQPPPVPPAFTTPSRASSFETPPPIFHPTVSYQHLPPPPRMSALVAPSGFVPLSIPVQYSASAMRAVHPNIPSPLGPVATRSNLSLPHTNGGGSGFAYRSRYSRSSVSLTRPHRLSSTPATSVAWSTRSGSTGPEDDHDSPSSGEGRVTQNIATANEIAFAILNGTPIPGTEISNTEEPQGRKMGHIRRASAPADTTAGAQQSPPFQFGRKAKGWKPQLAGQGSKEGYETPPLASKLVRSSSAELLSRFSPDSSPDDNNVSMRNEFEKDLDLRLSIMKNLPFRKSRSASPLMTIQGPSDSAATGESSSRPVSKIPQKPVASNRASRDSEHTKRTTYDEVKNKPLPKIAKL